MHAETIERPKATARETAKESRQPRRYDLKALASKITDENRHGEIQTGPAVGQEFAG